MRLEQGRNRHPSADVLEALSRALVLTEDERSYVRAVVQSVVTTEARSAARAEGIRPALARLLLRRIDVPGYVLSPSLDVLAANRAARALHPSFVAGRNVVRDAFLDATARARYLDPQLIQREVVAALRAAAGEDRQDDRLNALVDELVAGSARFRRLWERHDVHTKTGSSKSFLHPELGELTLDYESFWVVGAGRQQLVVYDAVEDTAAAEALQHLRAIAADVAAVT